MVKNGLGVFVLRIPLAINLSRTDGNRDALQCICKLFVCVLALVYSVAVGICIFVSGVHDIQLPHGAVVWCTLCVVNFWCALPRSSLKSSRWGSTTKTIPMILLTKWCNSLPRYVLCDSARTVHPTAKHFIWTSRSIRIIPYTIIHLAGN